MVLNIKIFHRMASNCPAPAVASTSEQAQAVTTAMVLKLYKRLTVPTFMSCLKQKPQARVTKKCKQQDDFQAKMLQVLEQQTNSEVNDDEVVLAMMAMAKKIKRSLDPDDGAEVIDEMQQLLSRFIRSKKAEQHPDCATRASSFNGFDITNACNAPTPKKSRNTVR